MQALKKLFFVSLVGFFFAVTPEASAQRLIPGQYVFSAKLNPWQPIGGDISFGLCTYSGRMFASVTYGHSGNHVSKYTTTLSEQESAAKIEAEILHPIMNHNDIYASFGYMFRVVNNRQRSLNFYVGASFDNGVKIYRYDGGMAAQPYEVQAYFTNENPIKVVNKDGTITERINERFVLGTNLGIKERAEVTKYTLGITPIFELEVFPAKSLSVSAYFRPRLTFINYGDKVAQMIAGIGLNYYFLYR